MKNTVLCLLFILLAGSCFAQDSKVSDVWVVFKTHFDLGFTDLPESVFERYRVEMMEKSLGVIEKNMQQSPEKQFSWTMAGWPLQTIILGPLQSPEPKSRIENAIQEARWLLTHFHLRHIPNH